MLNKVLAFCLAFLIILAPLVLASESSRSELVELANRELIASKILEENYFDDKNTAKLPLSISPYLVGERNLIVYGEPDGEFRDGRYRYLGYTMNNAPFTNYLFPNDVTSTRGLWDRNWIENPKENPKTRNRAEVQGWDKFNNNPDYEESIRLGLKKISRKNPDGSLLDFPEDKLEARQWHRYVHVYQPPTSVSWGAGIMFHNPEGNIIRYLTVPMAPEGIVPPSDLIAQFETIPSTVPVGENVLVGVKVKSTFKETVNTQYTWDITNSSTGEVLDNITYQGHGTSDQNSNGINSAGLVAFPANGERLFYARFPMPDDSVTITFRINNEAGTEPDETKLENNVVSKTIYTGSGYNLPYNVLSRKINHPLMKGSNIVADLYLPEGSWNGNATGSLSVTKGASPEVLSGFQVSNNPTVNEPNSYIIRNPIASATINRSAVGDNPSGGNWLSLGNPWAPITRNPSINFNGLVSREYEYYHTAYECEGHTDIARADFNSGTDILGIKVYSYNGKAPGNMPRVANRTFKNVVENNLYNQLSRNLFWTSVPYELDVIRWMWRLDEDGNEYDRQQVDGQYKRSFSQQDSAEITFKREEPMSEVYKYDRENAREAQNGKRFYPRVPFPTDRDLQQIDYPFKSGYYFNPAGRYKFSIKTVLYKNNTNTTEEHKELVDKVIKAFRYDSNLLYTLDGSRSFTINYRGDNKENRMLAIDKDYSKNSFKLPHSVSSTEETHEYFKEILEGYVESNTQGSKDHFNYREYVKAGQEIYRVTEETEVTITVNPNNVKMYTLTNMRDGQYYLRAWLEDFSLSTNGGDDLDVKGRNAANPLDQITVTVKGSMFDDLNN